MQMDDEDWDESKEVLQTVKADQQLSSDENDSFDSDGEINAD
jgi:hypothetical protein